MFAAGSLPEKQASEIPLRMLAHLGDAVCHLYQREKQILTAVSARQMHDETRAQVRAERQAEMLDSVRASLTDKEAEIVRRARNIKPSGYRKSGQAAYRKATAFEALVGYLYLTDCPRLKSLLEQSEPGAELQAGEARDP